MMSEGDNNPLPTPPDPLASPDCRCLAIGASRGLEITCVVWAHTGAADYPSEQAMSKGREGEPMMGGPTGRHHALLDLPKSRVSRGRLVLRLHACSVPATSHLRARLVEHGHPTA